MIAHYNLLCDRGWIDLLGPLKLVRRWLYISCCKPDMIFFLWNEMMDMIYRKWKNANRVIKRIQNLGRFCYGVTQIPSFSLLFSTMAILAALQSAAIFRLAKSWMELGSKDRSNFKRIAQLFSEENNNQRLREHMTSLRLQACIPHMGMYLTGTLSSRRCEMWSIDK